MTLILDDVWQLVHVKAFDVLDVRSRLLVTTRDRRIITALGAQDIWLDVFSPSLRSFLGARCGAPEVRGRRGAIRRSVQGTYRNIQSRRIGSVGVKVKRNNPATRLC